MTMAAVMAERRYDMGRPLLMTGRLLMMVAVLAVAACAPHVEWVKTSATPTQEATDEKQCNDIAYNEASLEMMSSHPLYPPETDTPSVPRDRTSTRLNSSHYCAPRMPSSA